MDSSFPKWVATNPFTSHVLVPVLISLLLIGLYFSRISFLQHIIAPSIEGVEPFSQREFGAVELLQNLVLLWIFYYTVRCFLAAKDWPIRLFCILVAGAVLFQFLEEIDYGAPFLNLLTDQKQAVLPVDWGRNLHNKILDDGEQFGGYLKLTARIIIVLGFLLAPLLKNRIPWPKVRLLIPSRWVIATVMSSYVLSRLAHWLDDTGVGIIDGVQGNLYLNISEFSELGLYYLFLLYITTLSGRIDSSQDPDQEKQHSEG